MVVDYTEEVVDRTKKLAVAVITQSLARAADGDAFEIAWLASKQAQKWLDLVNIPQSSMLARTGWMEWAHGYLADEYSTDKYLDVVCDALDYMEKLVG